MKIIDIILKVIIYLVDNWIAIFSLYISIYLLYSNSISIESAIFPETEWLYSILLDNGESIVNENGLIHTNLKIINSSNTDIGYFDLRIFDESNNKELIFYNHKQMNIFNGLDNKNPISALNSDRKMMVLNLPGSDYGVIKSHSVTSIDIVITPEQNLESIFLICKFAYKKPLFEKILFGYVNSTYKSFSASSRVVQSRKPNYSEFLNI